MFMSTLGLGQKTVLNWINNGSLHGTSLSKENASSLRKKRMHFSERYQNNFERRDFLKKWLANLPKMESHYCRKETKKLFLSEDFSSIADLYRLYEDKCKTYKENGNICLSYPIFVKIMKESNISIFKRKKDECDICVSYKTNNVSEEQYKNHREEVGKMGEEKQNDIENSKEGLCAIFCIDMEAVKLVPQLNANAPFYKMKLQLHNFTIYNVMTHESVNFVWDETNGSLVASVFATVITKYFRNFLLRSPDMHHIIIYSDGCFYQNRNAILSNALLNLCKETNISIEHKYLVSGHTQMECDSTHSLIERKLAKKQINLPSQFVQLIKEARKFPLPLQVRHLQYDYFLDFENIPKRYTSIRPGIRSCDSTVNMLRALGYDSSGTIYFKTNITSEYTPLPQRAKNCAADIVPSCLFEKRIPISKKYDHLQDLKKLIPPDFLR